MSDPGLDRHEWESELQALEDELAENAAGALPELDALVARMLEESGYHVSDPVVRAGEEREVVDEYLAAHEIAVAAERGADDVSAGDVGAAVNGFRAVFDHVVASRGAAGPDAAAPTEVEE